MRFLATALAPALLGLTAAAAFAQGLMEEAPVPPIDRTSRQAVIDAYRRYYLTSAPPPIEWTGSISPVNPGTTSLAYRKATLQRINWYRRMAGNLPNIVFDPQLNAKCQAGALMISAANMFTPFPPAVIPTTWPGYTPEGAVGAQNSLLALGVSGPLAIDLFMTDLTERGVGHRIGLLDINRVRSGTGDVPANGQFDDANTIWSGTEGAPLPLTGSYSWPPSGYCIATEAGSVVGWPRYWSYELVDGHPGTGGGIATVELLKNGTSVPVTVVASGPIWEVAGDKPSHGDIYDVTIRDFFIAGVATTISYQIRPIDPDQPKLVNVSTRLRVGDGENVGIAGFVISGDRPRRVIVRGIGPGLAAAGVDSPLVDPVIELRDAAGAVLQANDNWNPSDFDIAGPSANRFRPIDAKDAAIVATLPIGSYTVILSGARGAGGIAVVEVFDLDAENTDSAAVNVSTRARVEAGEAAMIGGFVVQGNKPASVVVRALGPSLAANGVIGVLTDPTLEIRNSSGELLISRDDTDSADFNVLGLLTPTDSREVGVVMRLPPGAYTAIVRGKNGETGVALVEAYQK